MLFHIIDILGYMRTVLCYVYLCIQYIQKGWPQKMRKCLNWFRESNQCNFIGRTNENVGRQENWLKTPSKIKLIFLFAKSFTWIWQQLSKFSWRWLLTFHAKISPFNYQNYIFCLNSNRLEKKIRLERIVPVSIFPIASPAIHNGHSFWCETNET